MSKEGGLAYSERRPAIRSAPLRAPGGGPLSLKSLLVLCLPLALLACAREPRPVLRLSSAPAQLSLEQPGSAELVVDWSVLDPSALDGKEARLFLHLVSPDGRLARTFDAPLTAALTSGELRRRTVRLWQSALDPALPAGRYELRIGLYEPASRRRWPLVSTLPALRGRAFRAAQVEVRAPRQPAPKLVLGEEWLAAEPGQDRQVLSRSWLREGGEVELEELPGPQLLSLHLGLPEPREASQRLFRAGESMPSLTLSSACFKAPVEVVGVGSHEVRLPLAPVAGGCRIELAPNFVDVLGPRHRSVALEALFWDPLPATGTAGFPVEEKL